MKKRILSFMTILILCLGLAVPDFAEETEGFANEYPRVIDNAELLSADERELLTSKLDEISTRQKVDVTVATTDTLDGLTVSDYAERFYESHNYGYGPDKDGTILLISMEDHDWYMATYGYAITAFTDAGIQYIGEEMTGDLSDGDFAAAFDTFADECDDFITQAKPENLMISIMNHKTNVMDLDSDFISSWYRPFIDCCWHYEIKAENSTFPGSS